MQFTMCVIKNSGVVFPKVSAENSTEECKSIGFISRALDYCTDTPTQVIENFSTRKIDFYLYIIVTCEKIRGIHSKPPPLPFWHLKKNCNTPPLQLFFNFWSFFLKNCNGPPLRFLLKSIKKFLVFFPKRYQTYKKHFCFQ